MFGSGKITAYQTRSLTPVTNTPVPTYSVTTNILSGSTVRWDINTNLSEQQTLYYIIEGATTVDLQNQAVQGSFTVDAEGNYELGRNLDSNIALGFDKSFQFKLYSNDSYTELVATASNVDVDGITNISATGGNITRGDSTVYHTFDTPGNTTFILSSLGNYDWALTDYFRILLVGGGGGGGTFNSTVYWAPGGGGGGGFYELSTVVDDMGLGTYNVTVGAGGIKTDPSNLTLSYGGNTVFGSNVVTGGGPGGTSAGIASKTGGLDRGAGGGGGMTRYDYSPTAGGAGTQAGGSSNFLLNSLAGGGGGGAGSAGASAVRVGPISSQDLVPGAGGNGNISNITGANVYYAGGGGGLKADYVSPNGPGYPTGYAIGGLGGGGNADVAGTNGLGGGGGANAAGGSGIVIVSYPNIGAYRYFTAP